MHSSTTIITKTGKVIDLWKIYKVKGKILYKSLSGSGHTLTTPPGFAVDYGIFLEARDKGCRFVQFYDREVEIFYTAKIEDFLSKGFRFNRGFGEQVGLSLSKWIKTNTSKISRKLIFEAPYFPFFKDNNGQ